MDTRSVQGSSVLKQLEEVVANVAKVIKSVPLYAQTEEDWFSVIHEVVAGC